MRRCNDKECKSFGKEFVDRGYGYPVCPSTPFRTDLLNKTIKGKPIMMFLAKESK